MTNNVLKLDVLIAFDQLAQWHGTYVILSFESGTVK